MTWFLPELSQYKKVPSRNEAGWWWPTIKLHVRSAMPYQHQVHHQINQNKPQTILFIVQENKPIDRWSSQAPGFVSVYNEK